MFSVLGRGGVSGCFRLFESLEIYVKERKIWLFGGEEGWRRGEEERVGIGI